MPEKPKEERIRELETELAQLKDDEKPLTITEIRGMSREEVERNWDRVKRSLGGQDAGGKEAPASAADGVHGPGRMARAYGQKRDAAEAEENDR